MDNELYTVAQAARYLQLSTKTVRRLIADKKLRASKISDRSWRIKKDDIEAYYQANTNQPKGGNPNGR